MSLNTITDQFMVVTPEHPRLLVKLESHTNGTFGFNSQKFPWGVKVPNEEGFSSKEEAEAAMQRFIVQTRQREPYLIIIVQ
jgi:hypothetical protein